jgi:histone H3/H4
MKLSKKSTRLITAVHAHLPNTREATDALVALAKYLSRVETRSKKAPAPKRARRPTTSRSRAVAATATSNLMRALEYISIIGVRPSREYVAQHAGRTTVAGVHIVDALTELGLINDLKVTALGTQVLSDYVAGDRDRAIDLVLTLY